MFLILIFGYFFFLRINALALNGHNSMFSRLNGHIKHLHSFVPVRLSFKRTSLSKRCWRNAYVPILCFKFKPTLLLSSFNTWRIVENIFSISLKKRKSFQTTKPKKKIGLCTKTNNIYVTIKVVLLQPA